MYVIARNAHKRPTLMHKVQGYRSPFTDCGVEITRWSRAFSPEAIEPLLCKRCQPPAVKGK